MAEEWRAVRDAHARPWMGRGEKGRTAGRGMPIPRRSPGATNRAAGGKVFGAAGAWWLLCLVGVLTAVLLLGGGGPAQTADFTRSWLPPSPGHPFGTDHAGRDLLERTLAGARVSLLVGLAAAGTSSAIGLLVGGLAGSVAHRAGGWLDSVLMRLVDAVNALPHLVLGIVIVALLGPSLTSVVISVALTHWTTTARIVRAEMLALTGAGFVEAAVGAGASRWWVLSRHLLGHVLARALLATVLMVPHAIMHESALSFLGLGLQDDRASLGTIIEQSRSAVLAGHWWPAVLPGLVLVLLSLAVYWVAERLRPVSVGRS
ncbi:ABC transporter permease [Ornithinimicrobium pratense]|uniref:ABC transporter permease n=1 Tax=Ornithinimicrobium pratense TaxID=2593973 RepID=A0A5J6V794_9MICO|nr:ABC transporter permease [Ornithinimicrobium pratense]QFG69026.1 ABC transporter permease [Ornithinimicrobium pratense]